MFDMMVSVFSTIGVGLLFSIPGIWLGFWLERNTKFPNRYRYSMFFVFIMVIVWKIWYPTLHALLLGLISLLGSTLGVYRMDIYWSMKENSEINHHE